MFKNLERKINYDKLPVHIAIILDGNGRWAQKRGLPRSIGHREGANNLKKIVKYCSELGIKFLTVYAFSTENWKRPREEVEGLMELLREFLVNAAKEIGSYDIKLRFLGDINALPIDIQNEIIKVEKNTTKNNGLVFSIALNYGSRNEIINAVKKVYDDIKVGKIREEQISEQIFSKYLYTYDIPDPDLLIRPGGELRLSNFLLWQAAYSELWFDKVLWPDFSKKHLLKAIYDYQLRHRRFGGI